MHARRRTCPEVLHVGNDVWIHSCLIFVPMGWLAALFLPRKTRSPSPPHLDSSDLSGASDWPVAFECLIWVTLRLYAEY